MSRVKRGVTAHARHKKVLDMAKGYRGRNKNVFRVAVEKVEKGLQYAYRDRRVKKRNPKTIPSWNYNYYCPTYCNYKCKHISSIIIFFNCFSIFNNKLRINY